MHRHIGICRKSRKLMDGCHPRIEGFVVFDDVRHNADVLASPYLKSLNLDRFAGQPQYE